MTKKWLFKNKIYTSELLNLLVETLTSIVEDITDLIQDKSNLSLSYRSVFVVSLSCFFKMLSSIFLTLIKRYSRLKDGQWRRKWVVVYISRLQLHNGLIQSWQLRLTYDNANDSNLNAILLAILSHKDYYIHITWKFYKNYFICK